MMTIIENHNQTEEALIDELYQQAVYEISGNLHHKDIIIIVHNQLYYVKKCIEAIYANTKDFTLYVWDNASDSETADYLNQLAVEKDNFVLEHHNTNIGFIRPNNILAAKGTSPYLILLNSDTEVRKGWDMALIGWLEAKKDCAIVGYLGGLLEANGQGEMAWSGSLIDYVCGWCCCLSRAKYDQFGLFDEENLAFAYGEDADLSLRLVEAGYSVYALHLGWVIHYGNVTINEVVKIRNCKTSFDENHAYLKRRWAKYLRINRILAKNPNILLV